VRSRAVVVTASRRRLAAALLAVSLLAAGSAHAVTCPVRTIREATAAGPEANAQAGLLATVDAFRADLGEPNNGNAVDSQGSGRRQITWDGGDSDAAPARLPADFFNAVAPRGAILGGDPRLQLQVSADASNPTGTPAEFGNVNATYPTAFATFSSPRLFGVLNGTVVEVRFLIPGADEPAAVTGFGAVFTDVDTAGSTRIRFHDTEGVVVFERDVLATPGNESLSFLGVGFGSACIGRVELTAGETALGPNDVTQTPGNPDVVVLDDLLYGEPQPLGGTVAVGAGGKEPQAELRDGTDGATPVDVVAFDPAVKKGVSVAVGDVTGDGVPDLVTAGGPKSPPLVRVFDGVLGTIAREFLAYDEGFKGGVYVAVGNVNGDGFADVVTGQGKGGRVKVFSGADPAAELASFVAYPGKVKGGVRVAAGDVTGDFLDDVATVPGKGMDVRVLVFDAVLLGADPPVAVVDFVALPGKKGAFLALGDVSGDGRLDYVVGTDRGRTPQVRVLDGLDFEPLGNALGLLALPSTFKGGVRVAAADVNGNGRADVVVGSGKGGPTTVRVFDPSGADGGVLDELQPYGPGDRRGAFVGAAAR
jgi:hypothetical protein